MPPAPSPAFDIQAVQRIRKIVALLAGLALVALAMFTQSLGGVEGAWHETVEVVGLAAIVLCIIGRAWCSLYIGGRKKTEIVNRGPYSITRNPLYIFSFLGAFGVGAQTGSVIIGVLFVAAALLVFSLTVAREEAWLLNQFGDVYRTYCARTPRFIPRAALWRDADELTIKPAYFLLTIRDGLVFLLAIPLFELIDIGQSEKLLQVILYLP